MLNQINKQVLLFSAMAAEMIVGFRVTKLQTLSWLFILVGEIFIFTLSNVLYEDLHATINPYSNSKILKTKNYS